MVDMPLDDYARNRQRRGGGGGGGGGSYSGGNRGRSSGNRSMRAQPYESSSTFDDSKKWTHDKFEQLEQSDVADGDSFNNDNNNNGGRRFGGGRASAGGFGSRFGGESDGPSPKVFIDNLHFRVTKDDVSELMGAFGELIAVRINVDGTGRSTGSAVVVFRRSADAQKAVREVDQRTLDGRVMSVRHADARGAAAGSRLAGRLGPRVGSSNAADADDAADADGANRPTFTISLGGAARGARFAGGAARGAGARGAGDDDDDIGGGEASGFGYRGARPVQRGRGARGGSAAATSSASSSSTWSSRGGASARGGAARGGPRRETAASGDLDDELDQYMSTRAAGSV